MSKDWWKNFFVEGYLKLWEARPLTRDRTRKEVKFLIDVLKLKKGTKVLDLCCGQGRHAILLAKEGLNVTGVDYSNYLLTVAKKRAQKERAKINFIRQDVRKLNLKDRFDVVLNLFTAFGYGSDEDNKKIIKNVAAVLKPDGYFLIDLPNIAYLLKNYKEDVWQPTEEGIMRGENRFDVEKFANLTKLRFI
jgi:ubiquinone/menaquinone biosynthesis C-methylase UbiE